jgi:hypothetical protein
VKVVSDAKYDEVLGVHMIGPHATDLIAEACVALRLESTAEEICRTIHPHPTLPRRSCRPPSPSTATPSTPRTGSPRSRGAKPPAAELSKAQLLELYHFMKLNRMVEEKLTNLYRQGKVVGGSTAAWGRRRVRWQRLRARERRHLHPPHPRTGGDLREGRAAARRDGAVHGQGHGPTGGRDLNTHFGWITEDSVMPSVISMLGGHGPHPGGAALAARMQGKRSVALNWIGDGGTSTGAFHEGLNFACVQKAPFVLIVEKQQVGVLDAHQPADGEHAHRGPRGRLRLLRRAASTATTCWPSTRSRGGHRAARGRARARPSSRPTPCACAATPSTTT